MRLVFFSLTVVVAFLGGACGTSSTTVTGPSLDRCTMTVANSISSVGASGGNGRLNVTAGRECAWSVTSNVSWITPTPPAGGQGDGSVDYVVAANPTADVRRGTLATGGQTLEVVQEGLICQFDLQPKSQKLDADGGTGSFAVEGPIGCSWTPTASDDWITITDGGNRTANGSVHFRIPPNTGAGREGSISVGGQVYAILQGAAECRVQLSATNSSFGGAGGTGTVTVTGPRSCTWTASANVPWISVTEGTSGSGNGTVRFAVQASSGAARNGVLTIGGQRYTVTQLQEECNYSISPAGQTFPAAGGQGAVTISTNSVCTWNTSDVPAWFTGMPPSGTGTQVIAFTVEPNQGPDRSAAIIIGGQSFAVNQTSGCSYSLAPGSHNATVGGGASSFAVNTAAGCGWTSSGVPAWITGVPASGSGAQTINFNVAANTGVARSTNILIGGQTFAVSQPSGCTISLTPTSHNPSTSGGASSFAVNTSAGCDWTSSGVPEWITGVPASGSGPQTINFNVAANTGVARGANILIGGRTFAVSQPNGCSISLTPESHNPPASGGASSFAVNTSAGCDWTSSGVPEWITGIPAGGTSSTLIEFTVEANPSSLARSATITIGGRTFTVTQDGAACTYSLSSTSYSASASRESSRLSVNTKFDCHWTSSGVPSWVNGIPASGTGPTTFTFTVAANTSSSSRTARITIAGRSFTVTQAGAP
jgi:all-beta uncharacterized protein/BACON domain-containing protein